MKLKIQEHYSYKVKQSSVGSSQNQGCMHNVNFVLFVPMHCAQGLVENFVYGIRGLKTSPSNPFSILVSYGSPSLPSRVKGYTQTCSGLTITVPKHLCASSPWTTRNSIFPHGSTASPKYTNTFSSM